MWARGEQFAFRVTQPDKVDCTSGIGGP
jgi:hypothetical protein